MDYQSTLKYLYESAPMFQQVGDKAYKEGLENTLELDRHFEHPHRRFRSIHIAGTNGKGSCSHTLAAILQSAGYKVGLYTSPHLIDFRERIRINGETVSEEYVVRFVQRNRSFFEPLRPSFFELTTAMAFRYFAEEEVDVAVIEVGLGGRLDCTNIIRPDLCIITNIAYDHMKYLGNTLEKIAGEKAGIIKEGVPVVIGRTNGGTKKVFTRKAHAVGAPILFAKEKTNHYSSIRSQTQEIKTLRNLNQKRQTAGDLLLHSYPELTKSRSIVGQLNGECQSENGRTLFTAIKELIRQGYAIELKDIEQGFGHVCEMTGLMGRWQRLQSSPLLICDTGHNADGISQIVKQLEALKVGRRFTHLHIVFGVVNDKDVGSILKLLPKDASYYFTQATVERALPVGELSEKAAVEGLIGTVYPTVVEAVRSAQEKSLPEECIFVGGSSFIVADLLANRNALNLD